MQLASLAREQVVVDDLAQQGVAEQEPAVVVGDEDVLGDGLAQRVLKRVGSIPVTSAITAPPGGGRRRSRGPPAARRARAARSGA